MTPQTINKHGLARTVPEPVKRAVRQRYGFGCVICGSALIQYHHHDPPFEDAKAHTVEGIVPVCGTHHDYFEHGIWSQSKLDSAIKNPKAKQRGFSHGLFDVGDEMPYVKFAGVTAYHTPRPICFGMDDGPLLIEAPEEPGAPFRLSGTFYDSKGQATLSIDRNEWKAHSQSWDVQFTGPVLTIREAAGHIHLRLKADPPKGVIIDRIDMVYRGHVIRGGGETLTIDGISFTKTVSSNSPCGVLVRSK